MIVDVDVQEISKKFKGVTALDKVSFKVYRNSIYGLLGSNGAGKTTLLHIITGLLSPNSGGISVLGEKLKKKYTRDLKRKVSIVPQKISLYEDLSIYENLYFFGKANGLKKKEIIDKINDFEFILKLGDLKRKVKNLSGGYKRRTSLAIGLLSDPKLLILDEAMVGIDLETKRIILKLLLKIKKNTTIIITTHSIQDAEDLCDYVCFLHKGKKILDGKTSDILNEYSSKLTGKIRIRFKNAILAENVFNYLNKSFSLRFNENIIELDTISGEFNASTLIYFLKYIKKYDQQIEDIEIIKPSLEEIMLRFIGDE